MSVSAEAARGLLTNFHRVASDAAFDLTPARKAAAQRRFPDVVDELRNYAMRCRDCSWSTALLDMLERAEAIVLDVDDVFCLQYLPKREVPPDVLRQKLAELKDGIPTLEGISTEPDSPALESDGWLVPMLVGLEAKLYFLADWLEELRVPVTPDPNVPLTEQQRKGYQQQEILLQVGKWFKASVLGGALAAEFAENEKLRWLLTMERNERERRKFPPAERNARDERRESERRREWDSQQNHTPEEVSSEKANRERIDQVHLALSKMSPEQREQAEAQRCKNWDESRGGSDWAHGVLNWLGYSRGWTYPKMIRLLADAVHEERLRLMQPTAIAATQKTPAAVYVVPLERPANVSEIRWNILSVRFRV